MVVSEIVYRENDSSIEISVRVNEKNKMKKLFFCSDKSNKDIFRNDMSDPFLVGLLIPAMYKNEDLEFTNPISQRLLYGIRSYIMPELQKMNKELHNINIYAPVIKCESELEGQVATGISGGIDSFYTILSNMNHEKNYPIKALCLYNLFRLYCNDGEAKKYFDIEKKRKKQIADELKMRFISVDTNLWEFYSGFRYIQVHAFYAMANVLCFQGYIKSYLYASGYTLSEFEMTFSDTAHYEIFIQGFLRTEQFEMISAANNVDRIEKTKYIAKDPVAQRHLDVCNNKLLAIEKKLHNCSRCDKCIRTMLTLDVLGLIKEFKDDFDVEDYYKNKELYWIQYLYFSYRTKDIYMREILRLAKQSGYEFPNANSHFLRPAGPHFPAS